MADQTEGVTVFNVFNGLAPTTVARVDTPGFATAVTCCGEFIAVADGFSGLHIIDISDPSNSFIAHSVSALDLGSGAAQAIASATLVAFVGTTGGDVTKVDMTTGATLVSVNIGGSVEDLGLHDDFLYALRQERLHTLQAQNGGFADLTSINAPGLVGAGSRRLRLFVGTDTAYAVHTAGYNVIDISNAAQPALLTTCDTNQVGWKHLVDNGSGTGIAAVGPNSTGDGPHDVSVYDLSTPTTCDQFLSTFQTPGLATAVSLSNALAYVADSQNGIQVINYLPYDTGDVPPTIDLSASFPLPAGPVEEGKPYAVTANVSDDVEVRNVEFYLDGERVSSDGSFPFVFRAISPLERNQATITLKARATDTGGNSAETQEFVIAVMPEQDPPIVTSRSPSAGGQVDELTTVGAFFNEPLDEATTGSSFSLLGLGPDGAPDDIAIQGVATYQDASNGLFFTADAALPAGLYQATISTAVTDLAGNALASAEAWTFGLLEPPFRLRATSAQGFPGDSVSIDVLLDNTEDVAGWSFGFCHDSSQLAVEDRDVRLSQEVLDIMEPDFVEAGVAIDGSGIEMGIVLAFVDNTIELPAGLGHVVAHVDHEITATPVEPLALPLCFCDGIVLAEGALPVNIEFTVGLNSLEPSHECGKVVALPGQ